MSRSPGLYWCRFTDDHWHPAWWISSEERFVTEFNSQRWSEKEVRQIGPMIPSPDGIARVHGIVEDLERAASMVGYAGNDYGINELVGRAKVSLRENACVPPVSAVD